MVPNKASSLSVQGRGDFHPNGCRSKRKRLLTFRSRMAPLICFALAKWFKFPAGHLEKEGHKLFMPGAKPKSAFKLRNLLFFIPLTCYAGANKLDLLYDKSAKPKS
jgi:hypothetical protein